MDVAEVVCGDPTCAPIDTVFTLVWQSGGKGVFALPMSAAEITKEDLIDSFPVCYESFIGFFAKSGSTDPPCHDDPLQDEDILRQWFEGKKVRWPRLPDLRFQVGDRVECRIGPHPVKGRFPLLC